MDKKELIALCLQDDRNAQTQLFNTCYPRILACIRQYFSDLDTCKDVLQEVFVKVFTQLHTLRNPESFDGWCRQIAVNACLHHIRQQKKHFFTNLDDLPEAARKNLDNDEDNDSSHHTDYQMEDVYQVLDRLPTGYRTVFNLFAIENFSHKEIAQQLGITESTSKSQFFKAKKMIENMVKQKYPENGRS